MPDLSEVLQVYLSAATCDFGRIRERLAANLSNPPTLIVREQSTFLSNGGVLLDSINVYVHNCNAVFHFVGTSSGEFITRAEANWLLRRAAE